VRDDEAGFPSILAVESSKSRVIVSTRGAF